MLRTVRSTACKRMEKGAHPGAACGDTNHQHSLTPPSSTHVSVVRDLRAQVPGRVFGHIPQEDVLRLRAADCVVPGCGEGGVGRGFGVLRGAQGKCNFRFLMRRTGRGHALFFSAPCALCAHGTRTPGGTRCGPKAAMYPMPARQTAPPPPSHVRNHTNSAPPTHHICLFWLESTSVPKSLASGAGYRW